MAADVQLVGLVEVEANRHNLDAHKFGKALLVKGCLFSRCDTSIKGLPQLAQKVTKGLDWESEPSSDSSTRNEIERERAARKQRAHEEYQQQLQRQHDI